MTQKEMLQSLTSPVRVSPGVPASAAPLKHIPIKSIRKAFHCSIRMVIPIVELP